MDVVLTEKIDRVQLFFDNLTPQTRKGYSYHIPLVIGEDIRGFVQRTKEDPEYAENFLLRWLADAKAARRLSNQSIITYIREIKSLLKFTKCKVDFDNINRALPKKNKPKDVIPTIEEIRKLYDNVDLRGKFVISLVLSSAIRVGAFDYFTLKDLVEFEGIGKLTVYRNEPEEYESFVSLECMENFNKYLEIRRRSGEKLTEDSPLVRAVFDDRRDYNPSNDIILRASASAIQQFFCDGWTRVGLENRNFKQAHGFRKFFKTHLEDTEMKTPYIEMLMGHSLKYENEGAYNKPSMQKLAEIYKKNMHVLVVSESTELKEKLEKTTKENMEVKDALYIRSQRLEQENIDLRTQTEIAIQALLARVTKLEAGES